MSIPNLESTSSQSQQEKRSKKRKHHSEPDEASSSKKKKRRHHENSTAQIQNNPDSSSPFCIQSVSCYLPLSPIGIHREADTSLQDEAYTTELETICAEHLSPLLLSYYPPLKGIILTYENARLSNDPKGKTSNSQVLARSVDEYAVSYVWVIVDFLLLKLQRGIWIEGHINVQNENYLGLVCWNLFNATIERKRLPKNWKWIGQKQKQHKHKSHTKIIDGHEVLNGNFIDEDGKRVEGQLHFRVRDFEGLAFAGPNKGFTNIEGTLLPEEMERKLDGVDRA